MNFRKKEKTTGLKLVFILLISCVFLSAIPFFNGPGLNTPQPIGKYLNGVFPEAQVSQKPYKVAYPNLRFDHPIVYKEVPNQNKIVLAQLDGKIFWFDNDQNATAKNSIIDLSDEVGIVSDGGFLGLTMHPNFGTAGSNYFYVYYATKDAAGNNFPTSYTVQTCDSEEYWGNFLILERFEIDPQTLAFVPGSRTNMIKIRMYGTTHRGGGLDFGNDGFLYLTMGDQTAWKKSQDITNNLDGGILRMDVDKDPAKSHAPIRTMPEDHGFPEELTGSEYWIPNDNPFLSPDGSNFEEYYGLGLRNPHRMTKDMVTGTFYLGDVGLNTHEEINVLSKGKNYGWPLYEGNIAGPTCVTELYNNMPHEEALVVFEESEANSIIGGYVYRGSEIPGLYGKYICGDYGYGDEVWAVDTETGAYQLLGNFRQRNVISFGQDADGEIYFLKQGENINLFQLSTPEISYTGVPQNLSETGAFQDLTTLSPSDGLIPYELVESFWSDGALKKRWMAVPNDGTHDTTDEIINFSENGVWDFPDGTVLVKHFDLPIDDNNPAITRKIETRFSIKGSDGSFYFLTYNWNEAQTDATLQEVGIDESIAITTTTGGTRYQTWRYPSNTECISCHSNATKDGLGLKTRYLNTEYTYDETNITANQLVTLSHLGILDQTITDTDTPNFLTSKSIYDTNATIDEKARSYLDLNCAYCHQPGTGNRAEFDLRLFNSLAETGLLSAGVITSLGIDGEGIVVPGDAAKSILYHRANSVDPSIMMPPLAKWVVDDDAVALISEWINQMGGSSNQSPVAVSTATPTSGKAPLLVNFTGDGSTDDTGISSYAWNFSDGSTSSEVNPSHTFTDQGDYEVQLTVTDAEGLNNTSTLTINVAPPNEAPVAILGATPTSGTVPLLVNFTGETSTDDTGITNYLWDFADGSTATEINPTHTFTSIGNYEVQLTVTDAEGLTNSSSMNIDVSAPNQAPVANITATPTSGTAPLVVNFTGDSSTDDVGIVSYSWDFADGSTSTQVNPVHTFTTGETYTVQLTVTDAEGLTNTSTINIEVNTPNQAPVAIIEATPTSGTAPLLVNFIGDGSTDDVGITSYFWDFEDGSTSSEINPVHTFSTLGNYTVQLRVTDTEGLTNTSTITINATSSNQAPVAVVTANPTSGTVPLLVNFTGDGSSDDVSVTSYLWDFGDGSTSSEINPTHTFTSIGNYTVQLSVTDAEGLTNSNTIAVDVSEANQAPVARITFPDTSAKPSFEVSFLGNTSSDDVGIINYFWDFGDGTTSSEIDPVHNYLSHGNYTVTLSVTDAEGLVGTATVPVFLAPLNEAPVAVIAANEISGKAPLSVNFIGDNSTDDQGITSYFWNFQDGATAMEANPVHMFNTAGVYDVTLTVTDAEGLTNTNSIAITVTPANQPPTAFISASISSPVAPMEVMFSAINATDDYGIASYDWNFGDGNTATGVNPSHVFENAGSYLVELIVTDTDGLTAQSTTTITAIEPNQAPTAGITIVEESDLTFSFSGAMSTDDEGIRSYLWNFGDGTTSNILNPTHTFTDAGSYTVSLTVSDSQDLSDTISVEVTAVAPNEAPIGVLLASTVAYGSPLSIDVDASSSTDDSGIISYLWDFGDGNTSSSITTVHPYAMAGNYTVELTVTDAEGLTHTSSVSLTLTAPNEAPIAVITATPNMVAPLEIHFDGSNATDDYAIDSYEWDFGDGNTATEINPTHRYANPGDYTISLTVTDEEGLSHTTSMVLNVVDTSKPMLLQLVENPTQQGVARIQMQNKPADMNIKVMFLHDRVGRLVNTFDGQTLSTQNNFDFSVANLRNGFYFLTVMSDTEEPMVLKMMVRN